VKAAAYHAGMDSGQRTQNQDAFVRDDIQIIVATVAFGMGIDKPDVRFVIHADLPKSVENYYQEIGRAGRDGLPAECILLYGQGDVIAVSRLLESLEEDRRRMAMDRLESMRAYAESDLCRRKLILEHFGEPVADVNCGACDNCLRGPRETADYSVPAMKFLSCVKRTGERFGAAHIVDVLIGAGTEKVERFGHGNLSTFGIGTELSRTDWLSLARRLASTGHLVRDPERSTLSLGQPAWELFRTRQPYIVPIDGICPPGGTGEVDDIDRALDIKKTRRKPGRKKARTDDAGKREGLLAFNRQGEDGDAAEALFMVLRALRKRLADEAGVPPYVVFPDRTLVEMATVRPRDEASLALVYGVGRAKLERYGQVFLAAIHPS
ncbi:MAG: ATP-dependent DNA helicase RecQ, partial [Spirochaetales bacterium]